LILIVASNKDVASVNIKKQILENYDFKSTPERFEGETVFETEVNNKKTRLITLNRESISAQNLTCAFTQAEFIVFISRHSSATEKPTLSVHTPGNLSSAQYGGIAREVSVSPANAMREALKVMAQLRVEEQLDYEVCYEGTHHGPSLNVPTMFVELGSSPEQWKDLKAANVVAQAAMKSVETFGSFPAKAVLGIGGPHYNGKFTGIALEDNVAFGHMIPKYVVPRTDEPILRQCIKKTLEKVETIILDWKGIRSEDKPKLTQIIEQMSIQTQKA